MTGDRLRGLRFKLLCRHIPALNHGGKARRRLAGMVVRQGCLYPGRRRAVERQSTAEQFVRRQQADCGGAAAPRSESADHGGPVMEGANVGAVDAPTVVEDAIRAESGAHGDADLALAAQDRHDAFTRQRLLRVAGESVGAGAPEYLGKEDLRVGVGGRRDLVAGRVIPGAAEDIAAAAACRRTLNIVEQQPIQLRRSLYQRLYPSQGVVEGTAIVDADPVRHKRRMSAILRPIVWERLKPLMMLRRVHPVRVRSGGG